MYEKLPFTDPEDGCWNCKEFDGDRCHAYWNNNEEDYYFPDRDDKDYTDICEMYDKDETIRPEDIFK